MRSKNEQQESSEPESYRELRLLTEVDDNPEVTQRVLSQRLGIALGLTNLVVRNLVQKGYIRATHAGWKRWFYNLTPEGFAHKLRLTVSYIHRVLDHYQRVRQTLRQQLEPLALHEESRIAMYGTGDFAELVYLGLKEYGIEEIDVFSTVEESHTRFLGMPVRDVATLQSAEYDRVILALLESSDGIYEDLQQRVARKEKLVTFFAGGKGREEA